MSPDLLRHMLIVFACLLSLDPVWAQEKAADPPKPKEISEEIRQEWQRRGFKSGYMRPGALSNLSFSSDPPKGIGTRSLVPAFSCAFDAHTNLVGLPDPRVPFGVSLLSYVKSDDKDKLWARIEIEHLRGLNSLTHLRLYGEFQNADLEVLAHLPALTHLDLVGTQVTGAALKHLTGLKNLTYLSLVDTGVPASWLRDLSGLKNITELHLDLRRTSDEDLKLLAQFANLSKLSFRSGRNGPSRQIYKPLRLTIDGLKHLAALPELTDFYWPKWADEKELEQFAKFPKLNSLEIHLEPTEAGLKHLAKCRHLRTLIVDLSYSKFQPGLLKLFAVLTNVDRLVFRGVREELTEADLAELRKKLPKCEIVRRFY